MHDNEFVYKDKETTVNSTAYQCVAFDGSCPWRCGLPVSMETLTDHVLECEKAKSQNDCPFQVLGCTYNVSFMDSSISQICSFV